MTKWRKAGSISWSNATSLWLQKVQTKRGRPGVREPARSMVLRATWRAAISSTLLAADGAKDLFQQIAAGLHGIGADGRLFFPPPGVEPVERLAGGGLLAPC